jgi:hypothetical protein
MGICFLIAQGDKNKKRLKAPNLVTLAAVMARKEIDRATVAA